MGFELIPAIDVRNGRCVRLVQGRYEDETIYSDDPVATADRWAQNGATRLHVVDLDGAKVGSPQNLAVIAAIIQTVSLPVQVGGGIREEADIERLLELGAARVIVGSRACEEPAFAGRIAARWKEQIIVGIDALDGRVAVHGWLDVTDVSAAGMAWQMGDVGVRRLIFTDIQRDGTLSGPNLASLRELAEAVTVPVIASGGVACTADVIALAQESYLEGVIIGKALYTGAVNLIEATAAVAGLLPHVG